MVVKVGINGYVFAFLLTRKKEEKEENERKITEGKVKKP